MDAHDPDRLLDINEAAELLQVKPGTLYSWIAKGKVPHRKVGALVRFHRGELMQWTIAQAGGRTSAEPKEQTTGRRGKLRVVNSGRSL